MTSSRQSPGRTTIFVLTPADLSIAFCSDFSGSAELIPGALSSAFGSSGLTYRVCLTDCSLTLACPMACQVWETAKSSTTAILRMFIQTDRKSLYWQYGHAPVETVLNERFHGEKVSEMARKCKRWVEALSAASASYPFLPRNLLSIVHISRSSSIMRILMFIKVAGLRIAKLI